MDQRGAHLVFDLYYRVWSSEQSGKGGGETKKTEKGVNEDGKKGTDWREGRQI